MKQAFRIGWLSAASAASPASPASAADGAVVSTLTALVNEVYAAAEQGLWQDGTTRTTEEEVAGFVRAGEIAVATGGDRLLGCVRLRRLDADVSEFGLLAVAAGQRGTGIGRELVLFAEAAARQTGHRTMQLELLVPRGWQHPSKEFLARWYVRIGYAVVRAESVDEFYPHLTPLLAVPCDFVVYRKDLRDAGG